MPHVNATRGQDEDGTPCPVLLVFDGHDSHIGLEVALLAEEHGIDLLQMPSHTSHRLQPLDVSCFYSWHNQLHKEILCIRAANPYLNLTRDHFAELMGPAFRATLSAENIKSGFAKSGIWPVDRSKIVNKLTSNEATAVLSPAVALDPRPNSAFLAPSPVPTVVRTLTPTRSLINMGKDSLRAKVTAQEEEIYNLQVKLAAAESARLDAILRLPLRDVSNTQPQSRRAVSALRSEDGRARVLKAADIQEILQQQDAKKTAEKAHKDAKAAARATAKAAKDAAKAGKASRSARKAPSAADLVLLSEVDDEEAEN